jgi:hypothetical protein
MTSILVGLDEALDPGSAGNGGFYSLAAGVKRHHRLVFSRGVKFGSVSYDGTAHTVTLRLARPHKGLIQVTVRAGWFLAAHGMSSTGDFTAVVAQVHGVPTPVGPDPLRWRSGGRTRPAARSGRSSAPPPYSRIKQGGPFRKSDGSAPCGAGGALPGILWIDTGFVMRENMLAGIIRPVGRMATVASVGGVVISLRVPRGQNGGADVWTTKLPP